MAYNSLIVKKVLDYFDEKQFKNIKSVIDFGDQDLNLNFDDISNLFKKKKIFFSEKKFYPLKKYPSRPRTPSSSLWLSLGLEVADRIDLKKIDREEINKSDGEVYELDLNFKYDDKKIIKNKKYDLVTDFGNNEHVFNIAEAYKLAHELCNKNGLIWIIQNIYGGNGLYNFDLSYFELLAAANGYIIIDSFMIIVDNKERKMIHLDIDVFKKFNLNNLEEIQVSYLLKKQSDKNFIFPYQGIGNSSKRDKFYEIVDYVNNRKNYNLKRFYLPRTIEQLDSKLLIIELLKRIKKKLFK